MLSSISYKYFLEHYTLLLHLLHAMLRHSIKSVVLVTRIGYGAIAGGGVDGGGEIPVVLRHTPSVMRRITLQQQVQC